MSRIGEIRARCEAATPGPWSVTGRNGHDLTIYGHIAVLPPDSASTAYCMDMTDARFIAHAREDVPWLLKRVEALEAALREAIDAFGQIGSGNARCRQAGYGNCDHRCAIHARAAMAHFTASLEAAE
jgi:hypothetical protein